MNATTSLPIFQVDAFASAPFTGNPAAVVPLQTWPDDAMLQAIAGENNLAETAFFAPSGDGYLLRWFSPTTEVALCGHATLASAFVLWECLGYERAEISFATLHSGVLTVSRAQGWIWLDLPAHGCQPAAAPEGLLAAMGAAPEEVRAGPNWLLRFPDEAKVRALRPDMRALARLPQRGVIATARAEDPGIDFVSRFFAPHYGIDEDPVTGSAHCMLTPYWAGKLGKTEFAARQLSPRGGALRCRSAGKRVLVGGQARLFLSGRIELEIG